MKTLLIAGACLLAMTGSALAASFDRGEWVLARVPGYTYWFPGVVAGSDGGFVRVIFDDGEEQTLTAGMVRAYDWEAGSKVECQYNGGKDWYAGTITQTYSDGETLNVLYDDGDRERTKTRRCRSR